MKFGDIAINEWASDDNPQKTVMIIHCGKMVKCVSLQGEEVLFSNENMLRKIGEIDFSKWRKGGE